MNDDIYDKHKTDQSLSFQAETRVNQQCTGCGQQAHEPGEPCPAAQQMAKTDPLKVDPNLSSIYESDGIIGSGGMGVIYKARHRILRKTHVIKMIHAHLSGASTIQRFLVEAKAASLLAHPGIITIHGMNVTEAGQPYIVMDFVEGRTLSEILEAEGVMELDRFIHIFTQVCSALGHAHKRSVLHRDIKPSNIMVVEEDDGETIRVLDFGIAKVLNEDETGKQKLTKTGDAMGSPMYMSPEQAKGAKVDHRADIYSLGCAMFEMLAGSPPFCGNNAFDTMFRHMNDDPPTLREASLGKEFSPRLEAIIAKTLLKDREKRYDDMLELKHDLLSLDPHSITATSDIEQRLLQTNATKKKPKNNKWVVAGLSTAIAITAGYLAYIPLAKIINPPAKDSKPQEDLAFAPSVNVVSDFDIANFLPKARTTGKLLLKDTPGLTDNSLVPLDKEKDLKLKSVDLSISTITDEGLKHIANQDELEDLNLTRTQVKTLKPIDGKFDKLKRLTLAKTPLETKAYGAIASFKNLRDLDLSETDVKITDLASIIDLQELRNLNVSQCDSLSTLEARSLQDKHPSVAIYRDKDTTLWTLWMKLDAKAADQANRIMQTLNKQKDWRLYTECLEIKATTSVLDASKDAATWSLCQEGITLLNQINPPSPRIPSFLSLQAICLERQSKLKEAIKLRTECDTKAASAVPESAFERARLNECIAMNAYQLAQDYHALRKDTDAAESIVLAIQKLKEMKLEPQTADAQILSAKIREATANYNAAVVDYDAAVARYDRVAKDDPTNKDVVKVLQLKIAQALQDKALAAEKAKSAPKPKEKPL